MRSMRYTKGAVVAAACAALLVPAGAAYAGSGETAAPSDRAAKSAAPSPEGNPSSKLAQEAGVCDDATEIGERGLITKDGKTIASVKQFYSKECQENYGYLWVWEDFRDGAEPYDVSVGVYSDEDDTVHGKRSWKATDRQEFWSSGSDTVADCTSGFGELRPAGDPQTHQASSETRC
ncbi:hypothetical protein E0L36_03225 [Streptomyces sp. AJS327]|uniref:hypothetical protein n=1 Tax=Streptomyces sp. AJS327 TaxID=2545265 RepID=UPI0015DEDCD2|nr:hypothetical protein [Streptomyces sp. AJS327]MBA0049944.1 hypothetical protein [Streptomyces sp. AJS327]